MKALILAAGLGTRLKPLTDTLPKALVPLAGKPLLQWQIEHLKSIGIADIVVNVHHFPDLIIDFLKANDNFGCNIAVSDERDLLLETGGALRHAKSLLTSPPITNHQYPIGGTPSNSHPVASPSPILICNVDILSNIDIPALLRAYNPDEMGVIVVAQRQTQRYFLFDESARLCGWQNIATGQLRGPIANSQLPITNSSSCERPLGGTLSNSEASNILSSLSPYAFSGMHVLNPRIFDYLDEYAQIHGEKFSLVDLYLHIADKEVIRAYVPENYRMMDVGKIDQLSEAEAFALSLT